MALIILWDNGFYELSIKSGLLWYNITYQFSFIKINMIFNRLLNVKCKL